MEGDNLLKKYNTVRYKVSTNIKKEFDKEPVCDKKFMKTKIWCFGDQATDSCDKEMSKASSNHTCLAVITVDSAL